ncbi:shikimate dehydrogenase [Angustibacter peucedani]
MGPGSAAPARRAAVLGHPVAHSLSPVLHRAAYASLGLVGWGYDAVDVADADALAVLVRGLDEGWAGLSLTMPLKRLVQPLLDELSPLARATGSVNTVVRGGDGRLLGDNTDVEGLVVALREAGLASGGAGVVLGGGATAASAVAALGQLGCASPAVVVRSPQRAGQVVAAGETLGTPVRLVPWETAAVELAAADVVVSTVPSSGHEAVLPVVRAAGPVRGLLLDVTYDPWPTAVAEAWQAAGGAATGGFGMLLHQAVAQVRLMTGRVPDVEAVRAAGAAELARR